MNRKLYAVIVLSTAMCGCRGYANFILPAPEQGGPRPPFTWVAAPDPELRRGAPGEWDSVDVLNPSVILFRDKYLNLYSGFDGHTWSTGAAISQDGVHWTKQGRVMSPSGWEGASIAANGSAIVDRDEILYWYQAGDPLRIALARSADGITWRKSAAPVLSTGPYGSFDERGVADPYVIRAGGQFYLFYLGMDRARRQRMGVARSSDGVRWDKLRSNPLLELGGPGAFDEMGLGEPAVWSSGGFYWMLYTGRDRGERRRLGLAKSADGVHWERVLDFAPIAGDQPWDSEVICDPSIEIIQNIVRVWYGGGDVARPDQNIHGQIGTGILRAR